MGRDGPEALGIESDELLFPESCMQARFLLCLGALLLALVLPAQAQTSDLAAKEKAWDARIAAAKEKQARGKSMKEAARKRFDAEQKACFRQFRVTDCQKESRLRYNQATKEARLVENEGSAEEREVRKERRDDKDARYAAEAPKRAQELRDKETAVSSQRSAEQLSREKKLADKAQKAKEGAARRARDAERIREKQEAHERKVQKRMERAARREAEAAAKAAPAAE